MHIEPFIDKEIKSHLYMPKHVSLSEEELFFTQIDNGEIKVKSNEEVLANLANTLGLK